jgi:pyridinium-3,5-bisthiocarboxylic acid mononucleotide nickel chelatase
LLKYTDFRLRGLMKIAYFDPFSGVSGNMILGALLDCGLDIDKLLQMLEKLNLEGWHLEVEKVFRKSLQGTFVRVSAIQETTTRNLADIRQIISLSGLPDYVVEKSLEAFQRLAEAESTAHGISVDKVHFHETGAIDAIIDIVGSFCGFYSLGVEQVFSSAVATGTGTVTCAHGILPVPAPATMHILKGIPTAPSGIRTEITTPTGAAILATSVEFWGHPPPPMKPLSTGMGAGSKDLDRPNLLRVTLAETLRDAAWSNDSCIELKTVMDDLDARAWPDAAGKILASGAVDCYAAMCFGKKGRPAMEATIICPQDAMDAVIECIFRNTTTIGLRFSVVRRAVLDRELATVETRFGTIGIKRVFLDGKLLRAEPEYEDCAAASRQYNVPVHNIISAARCEASSDERS